MKVNQTKKRDFRMDNKILGLVPTSRPSAITFKAALYRISL
ncbi:MAG: hypothetical protein FCKEOINB_00778 [Nitrosomonas sp.]|nr:hypothetical protein [Nitrosomonas sp.]